MIKTVADVDTKQNKATPTNVQNSANTATKSRPDNEARWRLVGVSVTQRREEKKNRVLIRVVYQHTHTVYSHHVQTAEPVGCQVVGW